MLRLAPLYFLKTLGKRLHFHFPKTYIPMKGAFHMEKELKTKTLAVRVTSQEKELIREKAAEQGLTVSMYIYNILFNKGDKPNEEN